MRSYTGPSDLTGPCNFGHLHKPGQSRFVGLVYGECNPEGLLMQCYCVLYRSYTAPNLLLICLDVLCCSNNRVTRISCN